MDSLAYKNVWQKPVNLNNLNHRIHDGAPIEKLWDRAVDRRDTMFQQFFPRAKPQAGARVMELGSGVGWIMQAMLDAYDIEEIIGLDISENMIEKAQERWQDERARFTLYDGLSIPIPDNYFDNIYSVACIQHIEKHSAYIIFEELLRLLKPGGHITIHLLSVQHMPHANHSYSKECWNHINNTPAHWHHYYAKEELDVIFNQLLQVKDYQLCEKNNGQAYYLHFSK